MSDMIEFICDTFIEASQETVFGFLTEQNKAEQWFGEIVEIDGCPGGCFMIASKSGMKCVGEFVEVVPHEKVVFTWGGVEDLPPCATTVEIILRPENGGTRLSLRHYDIPTQKAADSFGNGWPNHALPLLKRVSEGETIEERCFQSARDCCGPNEAAA